MWLSIVTHIQIVRTDFEYEVWTRVKLDDGVPQLSATLSDIEAVQAAIGCICLVCTFEGFPLPTMTTEGFK